MIAEIDLYVSADSYELDVESPIVVQETPIPAYDGPVEVTPTGATQILETTGYRMEENITVHPIPTNYGLITWDGSVLTVS